MEPFGQYATGMAIRIRIIAGAIVHATSVNCPNDSCSKITIIDKIDKIIWHIYGYLFFILVEWGLLVTSSISDIDIEVLFNNVL